MTAIIVRVDTAILGAQIVGHDNRAMSACDAQSSLLSFVWTGNMVEHVSRSH